MIETYACSMDRIECPALPCTRKGRPAMSSSSNGRQASGFPKRRASRRRDSTTPVPSVLALAHARAIAITSWPYIYMRARTYAHAIWARCRAWASVATSTAIPGPFACTQKPECTSARSLDTSFWIRAIRDELELRLSRGSCNGLIRIWI